MQILMYFVICILATTIGAISGIGGGVIIKPVFDAISGMPVASISFLSGCTVLSMSIVSLLRSKGGAVKVEAKRGTLLAIGAAVGGLAGKAVFDVIKSMAGNDGLVGVVQSVLMIVLTGGVLVYVLNKKHIRTLEVKNAAACVLIGFLLGMLSAFLGIGGGPINLAVLYYFFSMDTKTAALNSIYIILFSQITSLASTFVQRSVPAVGMDVLAVMIIGGVAGGFLGRAFNKKMSVKQVDQLFIVVLVLITALSCYNLIGYAAMM